MSEDQKKEDGLPKIAEMTSSKKIIVAIVLLVMLIVVYACYHLSGNATAPISNQDETYRVEDSATVSSAEPVNSVPLAGEVKKLETVAPRPLTNEEMASLIEKQKELQQRLSAPLMVMNSNNESKSQEVSSDKIQQETNPNLRFMEQVSTQAVQSSDATVMGSLSAVIAQGSFIHAILESATNSDLPGFLRAIVSEPVYSEDGKNILIPRGSRLIGEYKSGMLQGQSRIFIVWSRVITSQYSIQLGSAGTDNLGVSGIGADVIDRHFWQRFGMASLLSIIGTGSATAGVASNDQANSLSAYRSAVASSFSQSANESLQQDGLIAPTLKTYQGKPIMVFVAKDLQFGSVMQKNTSAINIF